MNKENKDEYIDQIQTDVSLVSFMAVISVFFIGSLISQFNSYDLLIKIPISFLIISTVGFLFSALILSNTVSEIIHENFEKARKHLLYGYVISEYLGIYLLLISLPLLINIVTIDFYLRIVTFCAVALGLMFYQFMGFSLIEKHFSKSYKFFSIIFLLFGALLFVSQLFKFHFVPFSGVFLLFILLITFLAPQRNFH